MFLRILPAPIPSLDLGKGVARRTAAQQEWLLLISPHLKVLELRLVFKIP